MSVELPEVYILANQMDRMLTGKQISNIILQNYQKLQSLGFINSCISDFLRLKGCIVESVVSRGSVLWVKFDNRMNLILAPEYGGKILYHSAGSNYVEVSPKSQFYGWVRVNGDVDWHGHNSSPQRR
ncbi:MAG: hypothetical protein NWE98_03240 [Candidatus Bathyarchaeota archaeon]|nr:hypothetical protein [Candidatus Bathyarchaeota archaeon]